MSKALPSCPRSFSFCFASGET